MRRCKAGYMPKKVAKMNALVSPNTKREAFKAGLELQFMMLLGEPLAKAAYFLEGDGFLAPFAFSRLNGLNVLLSVTRADIVEDNEYVVAMRAFANRNPGEFLRNVHDDVIREVWRTRRFWPSTGRKACGTRCGSTYSGSGASPCSTRCSSHQ